MKLEEILSQPEPQLNEISAKGALATALIGIPALGMMMHPKKVTDTPGPGPEPEKPAYVQKHDEIEELTQLVVKNRNVNPTFAKQVVLLAKKYEDPVFPKARDIVAIIGIESNFKPQAVSKLKRDPARGLMQVRPGVWKIDPKELASAEAQIKHGSLILKHYYKKLNGDIPKTVSAYNHGITKVRRDRHDDRYYKKYTKELSGLYKPVVY